MAFPAQPECESKDWSYGEMLRFFSCLSRPYLFEDRLLTARSLYYEIEQKRPGHLSPSLESSREALGSVPAQGVAARSLGWLVDFGAVSVFRPCPAAVTCRGDRRGAARARLPM